MINSIWISKGSLQEETFDNGCQPKYHRAEAVEVTGISYNFHSPLVISTALRSQMCLEFSIERNFLHMPQT